MAAEAEHGQSDEGVGGFEAEGDAGDEPDLGVDRFGAAVGQSVLDRGQVRRGVRDDAFCSFTNAGIRHRRAQLTQRSNASRAWSMAIWKISRRPFLSW